MRTKSKLKTLSWSPFFPGSASISILLLSPPVLSGTGGWWIGLAGIMLLLCCAASLLLLPPCNLPLLKWGSFPWGMVLHQVLHRDPSGLQLTKSFSSMRLYHGVQSFRNRLLQHGSPRGCGSEAHPAALPWVPLQAAAASALSGHPLGCWGTWSTSCPLCQ